MPVTTGTLCNSILQTLVWNQKDRTMWRDGIVGWGATPWIEVLQRTGRETIEEGEDDFVEEVIS
jgi:hypothetical protein